MYCPEKTFCILEKESEVGGLCRTKNVDGNYFDTGGGHFLHSKYEEVYDFIFSHVPKTEFNKFDRVTKIKLGEHYIDYPIEQNLWQLPEELQFKYISSIIDALQIKEPDNFKEWIYKNLGSEIADNYLIPYNEKIWGVDVDSLSTEWLYKIPKVDLKEILKSIILKKSDSTKMPSHQYFYYPKNGGFQVIVDSIYEKVKRNVYLNAPVTNMMVTHVSDVDMEADSDYYGIMINDNLFCKQVINTIPWTVLPLENSGIHFHIKNAIKQLKNNCIEVSFKKEQYDNDLAWCYIPDTGIRSHRYFYVNNYALSNKDKYICRETNSKLFTEIMRAESIAYHNEFAYPIPIKGTETNIQSILKYFEQLKVYGLGRWGEWRHHNSDVCIKQAMELFEKLESNKLKK